MGKPLSKQKKIDFIKKYNIVSPDCITNEIAKKARKEIGYSETTTRVDISCSIGAFLRSKSEYFNCL